MKEKKIIMYDSPEAAHQETLTLWVSSDGFAYHSEQSARYSGCTHKACECGGITEKYYTVCKDCRDKLDKERYLKMPFKEWDFTTPLCSFNSDEFFFDEDDIENYCEENELEPDDLDLIICEPAYASPISSEMYEDIMDEDHNLPEEILLAIDEFNNTIKAYGKPVSWHQGKFRTSYKSKAG